LPNGRVNSQARQFAPVDCLTICYAFSFILNFANGHKTKENIITTTSAIAKNTKLSVNTHLPVSSIKKAKQTVKQPKSADAKVIILRDPVVSKTAPHKGHLCFHGLNIFRRCLCFRIPLHAGHFTFFIKISY